jgi:predicted nuclease of restriction endonuclease-like (RecB) superfamily
MEFENVPILNDVCALHHHAVVLVWSPEKARILQVFGEVAMNMRGRVLHSGAPAQHLGDLKIGLLAGRLWIKAYQLQRLPELDERTLERGLIEHVRNFILELGKGFTFLGSQYHLEVGGQDYYLDLLFYHLRLRCYVVIDLKIEDFKPEFRG